MELAEYLKGLGYMPEQVQDFYPTPSTISTCMYYTGLDPRTMEPVYVPKNPHEKAMQRALIQYRNPDNYELVREALKRAGRTDLIGFGETCLIPPRKIGKGEKGLEREGKIQKDRKKSLTGKRAEESVKKSLARKKAEKSTKKPSAGKKAEKPGKEYRVRDREKRYSEQGRRSRAGKNRK